MFREVCRSHLPLDLLDQSLIPRLKHTTRCDLPEHLLHCFAPCGVKRNMSNDARVCYISSKKLTDLSDRLPSNRGRSSLVHELVEHLDLIDFGSDGLSQSSEASGAEMNRATLVEPSPASRNDLLKFHDAEYLGGLSLSDKSIAATLAFH